jgi:hypothetical protein
VWDSPKDAEEFATAYEATLAKRFPKGTGDPAVGFDRGDGAGRIFLARRGTRVFIVDGAEDAGVLGDLVKTAHIAQPAGL